MGRKVMWTVIATPGHSRRPYIWHVAAKTAQQAVEMCPPGTARETSLVFRGAFSPYEGDYNKEVA